MALIKCAECEKEFSDKAAACPNCACPVDVAKEAESEVANVSTPTPTVTHTARCPKCKSTNISYQREQTASVGGAKHSFKAKGEKRGCFYWVFVGWWLAPIKFIFNVITLGLFRRRKSGKMVGTTVNANKSINRTMAVCQDCGKSWKVQK